MGWMKRWKKRVRALVRKDVVERELDEELAFHLELETEKNVRAGMSASEARRRAALAFGGVEKHKEAVRDSRVLGWVSGLSLDFKLGFRMLVKYPGLTVVGGLAMAFAICVGALGFETITRLLHPTLPLDEGERIVAIRTWNAVERQAERPTLHDFAIWREALVSIEDLGAFRHLERNLITGERAEPVEVAEISASVFVVARVPPFLGRALIPEDERPGAAPVVVIRKDEWRKRFASDPNIVGQAIRLGRTMYTIVGVMPGGFEFTGESFWVPLRLNPVDYPPGEAPEVRVFGRLADGTTIREARAELAALGLRAPAATSETHQERRPQVIPYLESIINVGGLDPVTLHATNLFLLLLLVLICGNVALLIFARAATRENEIALRNALGASRTRIIGQLFTEALVLAALAAIIGLIAADFGIRWKFGLIEAWGGPATPFWERDGLSPATVLYACLLAVFAAVIAGVVPALKVTRGLGARLRQAGPGGGGYRFGGIWTAVVVSQVAAMVVFPVLAFILRGEAADIRSVDFGYPAKEFLLVRLELDRENEAGVPADASRAEFRARFEARYREFEERVEAEPGVLGVSFADALNVMNQPTRPFEVDEGGAAPLDSVDTHHRARSAAIAIDYLDLLNAPVVSGRGFRSGDLEAGTRVVIVNQSFVDKVLAGRNPIGRGIRYVKQQEPDASSAEPEPWYEIIGVVRDIGRPVGGRRRQSSGIYHPVSAGGVFPAELAVHVKGVPGRMEPRLRSIAAQVDPTLRVPDVVPLDQVRSFDLYFYRLWFWLVSVVSGGALLLSLTGIYSVLSFTVSQRTREIGIRLALGGQARRVAATIIRRPLAQVGLGVLLGAGLAAFMGGEMNETPSAIGTVRLAAYVALMVGVCTLASIVPVRRVLRVEPTQALKADG